MKDEARARVASDDAGAAVGLVDLLHLSDLHFGAHSRFQEEDARELGELFCADLLQTCRSNNLPIGPKVDLVLVTGDLAETGNPEEFKRAELFLTGLAGALGLPHDQFLFVPGNHDVSWPLCKKEEPDQEIEGFDDAELRRRLDAVKLRFFDEAIRRFYGVGNLSEVGGSPLGRGAWLYEREVRGLSLSIAALNSCERESHRKADHLGEVTAAQMKLVRDRWFPLPAAARQLKLVLVHHNPVATTIANEKGWREWLGKQTLSPDLIDRFAADVAGIEGKELVKYLCQDARVQLVLHGHQHAKDEQTWPWKHDGLTHVLSAGSLSLETKKLPAEEPLSARLIRLDTRDRKLTAWPLTFIGWARSKGAPKPGAFTLDPATTHDGGGYRHELYLPPGFPRAGPVPAPTAQADPGATAAFVTAYRRAVAGVFSTWELSVASGMTSKRQASARLDAMYVPLRFELANRQQSGKKAKVQTLEPKELLDRRRSLLISGVAGSGKTTWMRHTFRRLAAGERALPLMVELRKLANDWEKPDVARSLPGYLDSWAMGYLGPGWKGAVERFLDGKEGPVPVVLVDGWDELGLLGAEVREKLLAFMEAHQRVRVVVTSRPFGEARPSSSEGFEVRTVAELDDEAVKLLCERFYQHCHPEDDQSAVQNASDFLERLKAAADARALAGTPLLLTMLLMLGSREPLPEKRHQLYEICLRNLLWARPKQREKEGARPDLEHFRPADSEACLRAVAALALGVQRAGYRGWTRSALPFTAAEAATHLPEDTIRSSAEVAGFLSWLAEAAGVLTDRSDDHFQFAHLSFQEFLAAWQLHATHGDDRATSFAELGQSGSWWETLILWAALVQQQNPTWLDDVLRRLAQSQQGFFLAGAMLADGLGSASELRTWTISLSGTLRQDWPSAAEACSTRWSSSRQEDRHTQLVKALQEAAASTSTNWLHWQRLNLFRQGAAPNSVLPLPAETTLAGCLLAAGEGDVGRSAARVASSRILCGSFPLWPLGRPFLGLLQLWPGRRRRLGISLQSAAVAGAEQTDLVKLAKFLLYSADALVREVESERAIDWASDDWPSDWPSDWVILRNRYLARDWARALASDWARALRRDVASDLKSAMFSDFGRDSTSSLASDLVSEADVSADAPWLRDFSMLELASLGRAGARALLAHAVVHEWPEALVLQEGVRKALKWSNSPGIAEVAGLDPLWPALARHIGRCSTEADQVLLEDLARHPEHRDPPLSWGLQFIVRGDVMLDGGEVLTLDQLYEEAGIADPLPYLGLVLSEL